MIYGIQFDFDCQGEPPQVYIAESQGRGTCVVEVLEEPVLKPGRGGPCEDADSGRWSRDDEDWEPGPLAVRILAAMNAWGPETT